MSNLTNRVTRWGSARLSRRLSRSLPIVGAAIAVATVIATMRRKGFIGGAFDTGLNALPGIGAAKNAIELARGRDFFPDRIRQRPNSIHPAQKNGADHSTRLRTDARADFNAAAGSAPLKSSR
jgi:hypothetical protein